jgi:hypothetical protein
MLKVFSYIAQLYIIYLFLPSSILLNSCHNTHHIEQIRRIDTLINWNNNAKNILIIDINAIQSRVDSMKIKIQQFDSIMAFLKDDRYKSDLVEYKGLIFKYDEFLLKYPDEEFNNAINKKNLADLKNKIMNNTLKDKQLDSILNSQEKIILYHLQQSNAIVQNVLSVEQMYQRLNDRINIAFKHNIR